MLALMTVDVLLMNRLVIKNASIFDKLALLNVISIMFSNPEVKFSITIYFNSICELYRVTKGSSFSLIILI